MEYDFEYEIQVFVPYPFKDPKMDLVKIKIQIAPPILKSENFSIIPSSSAVIDLHCCYRRQLDCFCLRLIVDSEYSDCSDTHLEIICVQRVDILIDTL
ncbi:hypothetical protein Glove_290g9 [Diversispora epigaea]|uniref:Uncharacterized protein n=1 Tax=Diversispora epigaea TaxID=1348612 RepID=A0A397I0K7_9GLOM|nr:hypothetical protein Glove_290g9 [Diversispora epigaea]